jgi:hypothetical protein
MSYELSFSEEFFTGEPEGEIGGDDLRNIYPATLTPQCVMQALVSTEKYRPGQFRTMVQETLGKSLEKGQRADETVHWELLEKIKEYSTCDTLTPPIRVYVNKEHYVTVYEDKEEECA